MNQEAFSRCFNLSLSHIRRLTAQRHSGTVAQRQDLAGVEQGYAHT